MLAALHKIDVAAALETPQEWPANIVHLASQRAAAAIETKNKTSMSWHWTRSDLPARTSGCLRPEI